jgi:hypothetical protein
MDPAARSTDEVLHDHLARALDGDVEADLALNFAPDCVLLTSYGVFHGHDGLREAARLLDEQLGGTAYEYRRTMTHGELGFLEWTAETPYAVVEDGADSYVVREGRIVAMTAHYTVLPRRPFPPAAGLACGESTV